MSLQQDIASAEAAIKRVSERNQQMAEVGLSEKFDTPERSTPEKFGLTRPTEFSATGDKVEDFDNFATPGALEFDSAGAGGKTSTVVLGSEYQKASAMAEAFETPLQLEADRGMEMEVVMDGKRLDLEASMQSAETMYLTPASTLKQSEKIEIAAELDGITKSPYDKQGEVMSLDELKERSSTSS